MSNESALPALIVRVFPPSTINGWVNNSLLVLADKAADLIVVIELFVTMGLGVPAYVTKIDLITYVSLTKGFPVPKGFSSPLLVSLSIPTNLYWFTTAINLKRNF